MLRQDVVDAISFEIEAAAKRISASVTRVQAHGQLVELYVHEDAEGIDESLEDAMAWWGSGQQASVLAVHAEHCRITLRHVVGLPPAAGGRILFYKPKYLQKLRDIWEHPGRSAAALNVLAALQVSQGSVAYAPNELFPMLRPKQHEALSLRNRLIGFLWGPPGTGKTFTLGALIASIIVENPRMRVLLLSTTNRAVDEALLW